MGWPLLFWGGEAGGSHPSQSNKEEKELNLPPHCAANPVSREKSPFSKGDLEGLSTHVQNPPQNNKEEKDLNLSPHCAANPVSRAKSPFSKGDLEGLSTHVQNPPQKRQRGCRYFDNLYCAANPVSRVLYLFENKPLSFIYDGALTPPPATYPPTLDEQPLTVGIHGLATRKTYGQKTLLPLRWALTPPFHPYLPSQVRVQAVLLCYAPIPSRRSGR